MRSWFRPSSDPLVDEFLNSASLRWNKDLVKKLHAYIRERHKRAKDLNEDNVEPIRFPDEGITVHWETKEIVHYLMEHKKYRKSLKSISKKRGIQRLENGSAPHEQQSEL